MANLSFLSLFCTLAVLYLSFAAVPSAHALQGMNLAPPMVKRAAEHVDLTKRMIKKKRQVTPANPAPDPVGGGNGTPTITTPTPTNVPITTTSPTTTTTSPLINLPTTTKGATTTTTTSSSTTTSATSTSTTSTTSQTTSATSTSTTQSLSRTLRSGSTVLVTQTAESTAPPAASDPTVSNLPQSVIIGLIVAGSCLAGGAAIWTIIRKWKFSPSRHFEDRLEPINWEPTQASGLPHDPTVAALERASSRNGGSAGRGSLGSSDEHGNRNMTSVNNDQISMAPDFSPPHDFTAGAAAGGYGGAGYVDMHRGPSPAPGAYGASHYETPNPYDAYDYNNQYGQRRY